MLFKSLMLLAATFLVFADPLVASAVVLAAPAFMLLLVAAVATRAVWSRYEERRSDARKVLQMLLDAFFSPKKK